MNLHCRKFNRLARTRLYTKFLYKVLSASRESFMFLCVNSVLFNFYTFNSKGGWGAVQDRDYPNTWISIAKQMEGIKEGHNPKPLRSRMP
jgi:hypothetical protein